MGSGLGVKDFIQSTDNLWDSFFIMGAYYIEQNLEQASLYKAKFNLLAQLKGIANLVKDDVQNIEQKIQEIIQIDKIMKIMIEISNTQVMEIIKKEHWIKSYKFLQNLGLLNKIKDKANLLEFNIINAYLTQNYTYISSIKELNSQELIKKIYPYIFLDFKQISVYLSKLSKNQRKIIIQYILAYTPIDQTQKIIQFGRSLKRICAWEETLKMYKALIDSGQEEIKRKYLAYLYYSISKLHLLKGEIFKCLEFCQLSLQQIETIEQQNYLYWPKPNKTLKSELKMIQMITCSIRKDNNQMIDALKYFQQNEQRFQLKILNQLFVDYILRMDASMLKDKTKIFESIRSIVEQNIQQRAPYLKQSVNPKLDAKININKKFKCLLDLFIASQLIDQDYQIVYYLNSTYVPLLLIIINIKDLISLQNVARIFFYFGDYNRSLELAKRVNDLKLIADIHFTNMDYDSAIEIYSKLTDAESFYQLGLLYLNKFYNNMQQEYQKIAIPYFQKASQNCVIYKQMAKRKLFEISLNEIRESAIKFKVKQTQAISQNQDIQKIRFREDIFFLYTEVKSKFVPLYQILSDQIEKFLFSTERYQVTSRTLMDDMKIDQFIGSGSYGQVNKVEFQKEFYACKSSTYTFTYDAAKNKAYMKPVDLEGLYQRINEINILSELYDYKIPYVVTNKHIGLRFQDRGLKSIEIFNLTPIYQGFDKIQQQSIKIKIQFAEKVAICLKQLQMRNIAHQDIKPENILVDDNLNPVLIDFGTSISNFHSTVHNTAISTLAYLDPELKNSQKQSKKNDVYSFGITLFDLFTCKRPFFDNPNTDCKFLQHKAHLDEIQEIRQTKIQKLIINCAQDEQSKRYSINKVLYHFLMVYKCRPDVEELLHLLIQEFDDIDISDQEYELIKEFQQISLLKLKMGTEQIEFQEDKCDKCTYLEQRLLFQKYEIQTNDKEIAFHQITQCMRSIRNQFYLNRRNVDNIGVFYNFSIVQETQKPIMFYIFSLDNDNSQRHLTQPQQFISLLRTLEQINDNGINMIAINDEQIILDKDDNPHIINFLHSQKQNEDQDKNRCGWVLNNTNNNELNHKNEVALALSYFQKLFINFKDQSQLNKANNLIQFYGAIQKIIEKDVKFKSIQEIVQYFQQLKITQIIKIPTNDKVRPDIQEFCQFVNTYFKDLNNLLTQFVQYTKRFQIESSELQKGIKIDDKPIGKGGFGIVNKCLFDGKYYASKITRLRFQKNQITRTREQVESLKKRINEINILSQIQDDKIPYVLQNIHIGFIFEEQKDFQSIQIYNMTPIYKSFELIQTHHDIQQKIQCAEKVALCLKQLQMRKISHQDIKPDNLMVDKDFNPVVIDFGISIAQFKSMAIDEDTFTLRYADPQLVSEGKISRKNDVYSYGVTLYELFVGSRATYDANKEFLQIQSNVENIESINKPEIQYLINRCVQVENQNRFSLCQILFQFLMMNLCRQDVMQILLLFMNEFDDIDITEQEYFLIKEFQEISLLIPQMDIQQIEQVDKVYKNLYRCQYQKSQLLLFYQYQIKLQDKQLIFNQILQCMRFIRNLVHLNKKKINNICNFCNFRLILLDQTVEFQIFIYDNNYITGHLTSKSQLINILNTVQQIHQIGIFISVFHQEYMMYKNDEPVMLNFLYSFKQEEDLFKNQYGWPSKRTSNLKELNINHELKAINVYLKQIYNCYKTQTKINKQESQFIQMLDKCLQKFKDYLNVKQIVNDLIVQQIVNDLIYQIGQ